MNEQHLLNVIASLERRIMALEQRARPNVRDGTASASGESGFWAIIGPATATGRRWSYVWRPATKATDGQGGDKWVGGDPSTQVAYNTIENVNGSEGFVTLGNGVSPGNLVGSFDIKPAPVGIVVWMRPVSPENGTPVEYWFSYENGIDGACPST